MSTPVTYRDLLIDRYRLVHDWVPPGTRRLLDVGCGNAHFTKWLRDRADEVVGVDHNPRNCRAGHREYPGLHLAASAGEHLPFVSDYFDCVTCSDTLEHTDDDQATVDELLRVLKPGGTLVLTMPHGGLFGWMDAENLVNYPFVLVKALRIPKAGGGHRLDNFHFRPHRHYPLGKVLRLLGDRVEVEEVRRGGLFLYPFCYLIEKCFESFLGRDLCKIDYRFLRVVRAWDFKLPFGPLAFNVAVRVRKRGKA